MIQSSLAPKIKEIKKKKQKNKKQNKNKKDKKKEEKKSWPDFAVRSNHILQQRTCRIKHLLPVNYKVVRKRKTKRSQGYWEETKKNASWLLAMLMLDIRRKEISIWFRNYGKADWMETKLHVPKLLWNG